MEVEASSPLASMQPPAFRHASMWNFGQEKNTGSPSRPYSNTGSMFGPKLNAGGEKENFLDMDSKMMSSPTSTLAVDISQNFHIDQTPPIPTPRRSLFASAFANSRSLVTTPPIPASSPCDDSMDISPLPHKVPFQGFKSPLTPTAGGGNDMNLCSSPIDSPVARRPNLAERKKAPMASRTAMLRQPGRFNPGCITKSRPSSTPFGGTPSAPAIKLEELFGGASPEQKRTGSPGFFGVPPPTFGGGFDGSPIAPLNRPTRPSFQKPRGKVRRTLSMFDYPEDVVQGGEEERAMDAASPPKADPGENSYLPCFGVKDDPLRRITRATLCDVLDDRYKEHYDEFIIVDCRFEYEYEGGHISNAININTIDALEERFFTTMSDKRQLIIFHCEYSAHRAPRMALHLRKRDRQLNMHRYPALNYPDIYILEGGYSSFFNQHKSRCEPQHYVEMGDEKHKRTCEREMSRFRRNTKFGRTQSYTYGAPPDNDGSPSAVIASRRPAATDQDSGNPFALKLQRRMASY